MPIDLPITSLAALLNGVIFVILTWRVITYRRSNRIAHGDHGDKVMMKRVRAQGNAAEQIPLALILMALVEVQGGGGWLLACAAVVFTAGRGLHGAYFTFDGLPFPLRIYGMVLTLTGLGLLLVLLAVTLFT